MTTDPKPMTLDRALDVALGWDSRSSDYDESKEAAAVLRKFRENMERRPRIICLCGSTRFGDYFHEAGMQFTLEGWIVLSIGVAKYVETPDGGHVAEALGPGVAERLDELHLRKIDLADKVFVLNVGGYIGDSTRREIEYAKAHGKPIAYLEPDLAMTEAP